MNWFEAARQEWIRDMLQVYGFVNRQHLRNKFGISQPQASKDLQKFIRANPDFVHYDLTRKAYVRTV